jgi:deoxyadenosine/deoxycytidine kinase
MSLDINFIFQQEKFQTVLDILKSKDKKFIIIDGVISAGKTTLIKLIEHHINNPIDNLEHNHEGKHLIAKAIYEPVDLWSSTGALKYFYEDITKNCYEFQTYTYITRIASVIDEIYNNPNADIYILERSIWTDRYIFMELLKDLVGELRMTMYNQWCDLWAYIMPMRVDKWVLLDTSLEESLRRIKLRNRSSEDNITTEYQTNLYNKHIEFYYKLQTEGKPIVVIKNNLMDANFINDNEILNKIVSQIISF